MANRLNTLLVLLLVCSLSFPSNSISVRNKNLKNASLLAETSSASNFEHSQLTQATHYKQTGANDDDVLPQGSYDEMVEVPNEEEGFAKAGEGCGNPTLPPPEQNNRPCVNGYTCKENPRTLGSLGAENVCVKNEYPAVEAPSFGPGPNETLRTQSEQPQKTRN